MQCFSCLELNRSFKYICIDEGIPVDLERGKNYNNSYFLVLYGIYYTGEWKKGRPHGIGSAVF